MDDARIYEFRGALPAGGLPSEVLDDGDTLRCLDAVTTSAEAAIRAALELKQWSRSHDRAVRTLAQTSMRTLSETVTDQVDDPSAVDNWLFAAGQSVEHRLISWRRRWAVVPPSAILIRRLWTIAGLGLAAGLALCIATQQWTLALVLLVVRCAISVLVGSDDNLPFETRRVHYDSGSGLLLRCMASHLTDVLAVWGLSYALLDAGRTMWATVAAGVGAIMLLATLYRVAALQVGVQLYRLQLERACRNGGLFAGLVAATFSGAVPGDGLTVLVLAVAGYALYAAGEIVRVTERVVRVDRARQGSMPRVSFFTDTGDGGMRRVVPGLEPSTRPTEPGEAA